MSGGLFVVVFLARYLGPESFGLLNFSLAYVGIFLALVTLGFKDLIIRDLEYHNELQCEILGSALLLSCLASVLLYSFVVGGIYFLRPLDSLSISLVMILGLTILFKPIEVLSFWFEYKVESKYFVIAQNISFVVFSLLKILLILTEASLNWIAYSFVGDAFLKSLLLLLFFCLKTNLLKRLKTSKKQIKRLISDCWPLLISSFAIILYMRIDQIMIGQLTTDNEVGLYSAAARISEVWFFIPTIIVISVYPKLLKVKVTAPETYKNNIQALLDFMVMISIPTAIFFSFFGGFFIALLFGPEFSGASDILAIHIWSSVPVFLGVVSSRWLITAGLQKIIFYKTCFVCVLNVGLNLVLIPKYGAIGAAVATVICQIFGTFVLDFFFNPVREILVMKLRSLNIFLGFSRLLKFKVH